MIRFHTRVFWPISDCDSTSAVVGAKRGKDPIRFYRVGGVADRHSHEPPRALDRPARPRPSKDVHS